MNVLYKHLHILAFLTFLSACSPPDIDVSVEKAGDSTILSFSQDWGVILSDRKAPYIREISLHTPGTLDQENVAWAIAAKNDVQCLELAGVTVGEVPEDWQEIVEIKAEVGRTYTARVDGIGWGQVDFEF